MSARRDETDPGAWYSRAEVRAAVAEVVLDKMAETDDRATAARAIRLSNDEPRRSSSMVVLGALSPRLMTKNA